jgi:NTE family protein
MTKKALVLSGGGARGAYQLGVWKALREVGWDFSIVTGASIGALNSALIAMDDYDKLEQLWYNMTPNNVINTTETDPKKVYLQMIRDLAKGGSDTSPLYNFVSTAVDEEKVRNSKVRVGISTVELPTLKLLQLPIDQIPQGKLADFLVASATVFPFFKAKHIDDKNYADGGYGDNMPMNLAIAMGAEEIIAVQIFNSRIRKLTKKIPTTLIVPSRYLGQFLLFDNKNVHQNKMYGYNDTLKFLNYREGEYFTFFHGELSLNSNELQKKYKRVETVIAKMQEDIVGSLSLKFTNYLLSRKTKSKFNKKYTSSLASFILGLETTGRLFELDDLISYSLYEYNFLLKTKAQKMINENLVFLVKEHNELELMAIRNKALVALYLHYKIRELLNGKSTNNSLIIKLLTDLDVARAAVYLTVLLHE